MMPPMSATTDAFAPLVDAFERQVGQGAGGGALVVRMRGETVVTCARARPTGPAAERGRPRPSPSSFSTSEGIASTVVHRPRSTGWSAPSPRAALRRAGQGHYGFGGSDGWADPDLGLSVGSAMNRVGSLSTPLGDLTLIRISRVMTECARRAG